MPKKKVKKPAITGEDACVAMHTALRKVCDSNITSAAYNLIYCIDGVKPPELDPWIMFGRLVAKELKTRKGPNASIEAIEAAIDKLDKEYYKVRNKILVSDPATAARAWMYALQCTFKCFDDLDILGMSAYLGEV